MGWTSFHLNEPVKQWFVRDTEWGGGRKVLDVAIVNFSELYAAVRHEHDGSVICYTYMIAFTPNNYHNFAYKDMTEFDDLLFDNCPLRILKLLTQLENTESNRHAINFRARNLMIRSNDAVFAKIKTGQTFHTIKKVNFPGLGEFDDFVKTDRRGIFLASNENYSGIKVKIKNIKTYGIQ